MNRNLTRKAVAAGAALFSFVPGPPAWAQSLRVVPSIEVTQIYSDDPDLGLGEASKPGWITDVAPGLRIDLKGARAKGFLDFRYHDFRYSSDSRLDYAQRALNSRLLVEPLEKRLYFEARADTTQENRSPFGAAASPGQPSANANRIETNTLQLAPILKGRLGSAADWTMRYNAAQVRTDDPLIPDSRSGEFTLRLQGATTRARFNWSVEGSDVAIRNDAIGRLNESRARATLLFRATPNLNLSASGGYERSDFAGEDGKSGATPGVGLTWNPSPRSQAALFAERRYFGTGHSVLLTHRTAGSAWRASSVKDSAVLPTGIAIGEGGSLGGLVDFLLTSAIPDPDAREAAARKRMQDYGIEGGTLLTSGLVSFRPYVFRNSTASAALFGTRHAFTVILTDREQRHSRLDEAALSFLPVEDNRQRGYSAAFSRRFTPLATGTLFARGLRTEGLGDTPRDSRQTDYGLAIACRLGRHTSLTVGARHVDFRSSVPGTSYRENAVFLTIALRT